jgi:hypothetical protein
MKDVVTLGLLLYLIVFFYKDVATMWQFLGSVGAASLSNARFRAPLFLKTSKG